MNLSTPRIFIAATEQNTGKTTISLGLHGALCESFQRIGFIKPVGQRFVDVEGKRIDEDSVLIRQTYDTQVPIEDMSPIAVEPEFTRRYINHANHDALVRRIKHSFDRTTWEKDFTIIEGTGHAGVGSVFDLSNARVAKLLGSKVLLIVPGGIGRPIDEAAVNKALFDKEGVEVIGVVMNKLLPSKMEAVSDIARRGFERLGMELLGVVPLDEILLQPSLEQVCRPAHAEFLHREKDSRTRVADILIGAMSTSHLFAEVVPGTLLIVPGDREDVILACLSRAMSESSQPFCAIMLSDDLRPSQRLMDMISESNLPVMASPLDSYSIASRIHSMTVKTLPGDAEKILRIQNLISQHVDVKRILEKLSPGPVAL
ncbi:MAG: AAA family ATPase [Terrimicrobiaceae bacterium]